jgi:hypothetical protein
MIDDATQIRLIRAAKSAAREAREQARLAYEFNANSYSYTAMLAIERAFARLAEIEES